jgi:hypothetical protein
MCFGNSIHTLLAGRIATALVINHLKKRKMRDKLHLGQQLFMLGNIILNEEYEITLLKCNNA